MVDEDDDNNDNEDDGEGDDQAGGARRQEEVLGNSNAYMNSHERNEAKARRKANDVKPEML